MHAMRLRYVVLALALASSGLALAGQIEPDDRLEIAAAQAASVVPTQAVRAAEATGGVAYGFGMEVEGARRWYKVNLLRGGAKVQVRVDAVTGKVLGSAPARGEDAQGAEALTRTSMTLGAAITHAEREGKGPALEAGAGGMGAQAWIDVDVIQDHGRRVAHYRVTARGRVLQATLTGSDT